MNSEEGFNTCSVCGLDGDGIYYDDGRTETFYCFACAEKESARTCPVSQCPECKAWGQYEWDHEYSCRHYESMLNLLPF